MPLLTNVIELTQEEVASAIHQYVSGLDGIRQSYGHPEYKIIIRKDSSTGEITPVLQGVSVQVRLWK